MAELFTLSEAFLAFANSLNRPMTKEEKTPHRWILMAWESALVRAECVRATRGKLRAVSTMMERLRQIFHPDPIQQGRRRREIDNLRPASSDGNNKTAIEPMHGVEERQMNEDEAKERLKLMCRMIKSIRYLMKELATYHGQRRKIVFGSWLRKFNHIAAHLVDKLEYVDPVEAVNGTPHVAVDPNAEPEDAIEEE